MLKEKEKKTKDEVKEEEKTEDEASEDYPLGGMLEPFDIVNER